MIDFPERALKAEGYADRCVSLEETISMIPRLRERFGITRVGDTTRLDRTAIPTFCAIVPESLDVLGVYSGKGISSEAALVSAVMEAVERQAASMADLETIRAHLRHVCGSLDLAALEILPECIDATVDCANGYDLIEKERVLVPHACIRFPWRGAKLFSRSSTNGLASGNNLTEATYHALTEMIERHVWSLFYVRSELVPRYYRGDAAKDRVLARELAFPSGNLRLDALWAAVARAGLEARVLMLEEPGFPHLALAIVLERNAEPQLAHMGLGCSPSPAHAVERALTESVQSRVVDIQGAREDILRPDDETPSFGDHGRRQTSIPHDRWYVDLPATPVELDALEDRMTVDLALDLRNLVEQLRHAGMRRVVVVDISPDDLPVNVVRICAPDFETTAIDGRIGSIALRQFNPLHW
ncbi:MAG: YcaO-like family protein [Candidatus Eremiobacteraeota bacterium]|nr:YcaO-like family protein [Candidatus Eremiobacteraeota bacterium]